MNNGAALPTKHEGPTTLEITNLKIAESAAELNGGIDPFLPLTD